MTCRHPALPLLHRHTEGVLTFPPSLSEAEEKKLEEEELEAEEKEKKGGHVQHKGNASLQSFQVPLARTLPKTVAFQPVWVAVL